MEKLNRHIIVATWKPRFCHGNVYQIVQRAIKKIMGQTNYHLPPCFQAKCSTSIKKRPGRMEFQRGVLVKKNDGWIVNTTPHQGSGILSSMTQANCFIVLNKNDSFIEK